MTTVELFTLCVLSTATTALAQLATLPPASVLDGSPVQNIGPNAGVGHWDDPTTLGAYRVSGDGTVPLSSLSNIAGLSWGTTAPAEIGATLTRLSLGGGTVRAIFVGETAGWLNDFGYTRTGVITGPDSFTAFRNMQSVPPANVRFGDHIDIGILAGDSPNLDFWLNATDSFSTEKRPLTQNGGLYTVLNGANRQANDGAGNVLFSQSPLLVNTWVPSSGAYQDRPTYLIAIEDWPSDRGGDADYTDFIFALQFFEVSGTPFGETPVPEPSTFGLIAGAGLVGLAVLRRRKSGNIGRSADERV